MNASMTVRIFNPLTSCKLYLSIFASSMHSETTHPYYSIYILISLILMNWCSLIPLVILNLRSSTCCKWWLFSPCVLCLFGSTSLYVFLLTIPNLAVSLVPRNSKITYFVSSLEVFFNEERSKPVRMPFHLQRYRCILVDSTHHTSTLQYMFLQFSNLSIPELEHTWYQFHMS